MTAAASIAPAPARLSPRVARTDPPRIFIQSLDHGYLPAIRAAFEWTGFAREIGPDARIAIKPNLTFPVFRKGVMTNPEALNP